MSRILTNQGAPCPPIVGNQRPLGDEILDTLIPSLSPFIQSRGWMSVRLFSKGLGAASHCWLCLLYLIPTQRPGNDMQAPAAFLAQCLVSLTLSLSPKFESEQSRATGVVGSKILTLISLLWVCEVCHHACVADRLWPGALKRNTTSEQYSVQGFTQLTLNIKTILLIEALWTFLLHLSF